MTRKKIEYVSRQSVAGEYKIFQENAVREIARSVNKSHTRDFSAFLIQVVSSVIHSKLTIPLYLECATSRDMPSYRQQLAILYDFRQLLRSERNPKYFTKKTKKYQDFYEKICALLDEVECYEQTGKVSEDFYKALALLGKENFPATYTTEYLAYTKALTLVMIDKVTDMVRSQIYRFFPVEGPEFVQNILQENPYDGIHHVEVENGTGETLVGTKKVTFS